ncbi:hypothetical protein CROQUDRAFT_664032 [Cronartium quercuum f. sp. fusiforme G11]|uniref:Protein phosphatase methylesterase 1 n=1 Tax=Cronartium quercuum f. sp. fusiforme G11 TaxID=708437 RepID=A0A9P6NCJ6_9BASI|nr:hypothetical protein CROQUDRAFT_664032 [Cronartium quercuum f. sp. fusiforme G11]
MTTPSNEERFDVLGELPDPSSHVSTARSPAVSDSYSPLSASGCFEEALSIDIETLGVFRVYLTPPRPVSAASLSPFSHSYTDEDEGFSKGIVFVFHHGAGYSGLSAACFAKAVRAQSQGEFGVMSFDCRGHGSSRIGSSATGPPDPPDLSLSTLANDMVSLLKMLYPNRADAPSLVLIGHSMGGAVVTEACARIQAEVSHVIGLVNLDIVEGSALDSLADMMSLVNLRPQNFRSKADCIKYHIDSRIIRNLTSARTSVPSLITVHRPNASRTSPSLDQLNSSSNQPHAESFTWVTNLRDTQPFWLGWYTGLSQKFLAQRTARLLVLAGTDRLDRDLMIGQMQGKYQLMVMSDVGHCLHEDDPEKLAEVVIAFCRRNETFTSTQILARLGKKS